MNLNAGNKVTSTSGVTVDNILKYSKNFDLINFLNIKSNNTNNHTLIVNNMDHSFKDENHMSQLSTTVHKPHSVSPVNNNNNNNNQLSQKTQSPMNSVSTKDSSSNRLCLPRQRSFDQGGEGKLSSSQVKQKLKECVLNKKINKLNKSPMTGPSPQNSFESEEQQVTSVVSTNQPSAVLSSYPLPTNIESTNISQEEFPIRKTSSLPNLKVRSALKQKALDRRPSPLSKRRTKLSSIERNSNGTTVSGLTLFNQTSTLNSECSMSNNNSNNNNYVAALSQTNSIPSSKIAFGKYQPHLYDNETGPTMPVNLLTSGPFKSINPTAQSELFKTNFSSYQLPLQALFNSQSQLLPSFTSLPNLNLAHSLSALLLANKPSESAVDNSQNNDASMSVDMKEMDSSCSQSPDVLIDPGVVSGSSSVTLPSSINKLIPHGYSPRRNFNSGNSVACRPRSHKILNRTNSAPLPLGNGSNAASVLQLAIQEQKLLLVKQQLRQKVLHRSNTGKPNTNSEDFQMSMDRNNEFDWKNVCTRTLSDSLITSNERTPQRSLSLDDSSSEFDVGQHILSAPFSPDANKLNNSFPFRMLPNHSTTSGFNIQTSNSGSINKLPSPILEEKILEYPNTTAIVYDVGMLSHRCLCGNEDIHPESSRRLAMVWERLKESQIVLRCHVIQGKKASMDDLQLCHEDTYSVLFGTNPANRLKINPQLLMSVEFCRLPCGGIGVDSDTIWNNAHTANAARLAVGCVVELTLKIVRGELRNGFALVRPPGHHAEFSQAMGFGYFNSVAIAAKKITMQTAVKRVLIIDWDIHHGNGTQQIFYNDPSVLYISLHRHDNGHFFPGTGLIEEIGEGAGTNYNINIAWKSPPDGSFLSMSDAEYIAAFVHIVLPVAKEFNPDLIIVSAGFDATKMHSSSLGGYSVSPACFGWMTQKLVMSGLAEGRVVMALEGGYDIASLCDCVEVCMRALIKPDVLNFTESGTRPLKDAEGKMTIPSSELNRVPCDIAIETLFTVSQTHKKKWQCFRFLTKESIKYSYNDLVKKLLGSKSYDSIPLLAMSELTVQHEHSKHEPKQVIDYEMICVKSPIIHSEPMEQESN